MLRFPRLLSFALCALAFTAMPLLVACGGGDEDSEDKEPSSSSSNDSKVSTKTVKVDTWTAGMCDAVLTWLDDVGTLSALVDLDTQTEAAQIKKTMVDYLTDMDDRTEEFKTDIDSLGNPDMTDGKKIQAALRGAAGDVVTIFNDALKEAKGFDERNARALAEELTTLGDSLVAAGDRVGEAFTAIDTDYDTTKISEAAEALPGCTGLFN